MDSFEIPEMVLTPAEHLDAHTFLSFARTNKSKFALPKKHERTLCPKALKNSASSPSWGPKWVPDIPKTSTPTEPKLMKELEQMYLLHEMGKLEIEMIDKMEYGEISGASWKEIFRKRVLLITIGRRLGSLLGQGADAELVAALRIKRHMASFYVYFNVDGDMVAWADHLHDENGSVDWNMDM